MRFQTELRFPEFRSKLAPGDQVILLGSCFSLEMVPYFKRIGLPVLSNPFGVLFHPESVSNAILNAIVDDREISITQRNDIFHDWDSSGELWSLDAEAIVTTVKLRRKQLKEALAQPNAKLIITFGTSFIYKLKNENRVVANCHKQPSDWFTKEMSSVQDMLRSCQETLHLLQNFNPSLTVFFSISPVRHIKDGIIENSLSKARLVELAHELCKSYGEYIPSYELIIDELRDYRFYESDLIHPNKMARDYLWEKLSLVLLDTNYADEFNEIEKYHIESAHRSLNTGSIEDRRRVELLSSKRESLIKKYPKSILE